MCSQVQFKVLYTISTDQHRLEWPKASRSLIFKVECKRTVSHSQKAGDSEVCASTRPHSTDTDKFMFVSSKLYALWRSATIWVRLGDASRKALLTRL